MIMEKKYLSWDDVRLACWEVKRMADQFDVIIAPSRGGLIPATLISHMTDKPMYPIICSTRDHRVDPEIPNQARINGKRVLIVDDICDSGLTLAKILCALNNRMPADVMSWTVVINLANKREIDHNVHHHHHYSIATNGEWAVFPWEIG